MNPNNTVTLIGRITREPELRYTQNQTAILRFSLAVDRMNKDKETDFITCVAFGNTAERIDKYADKGNRISISGSIRTGSYDGKNGKVYTTEVNVDNVFLIDFKDSGMQKAKAVKEQKNDFEEINDDVDLPF